MDKWGKAKRLMLNLSVPVTDAIDVDGEDEDVDAGDDAEVNRKENFLSRLSQLGNGDNAKRM